MKDDSWSSPWVYEDARKERSSPSHEAIVDSNKRASDEPKTW